MRLRTYEIGIQSEYLKIVCNCNFFRNLIERPIRTTTGVKNINSTEVSNLLVPLPPLAEQQRIVEKVNVLMTSCNELEKEVSNAKKYVSQLMKAVLQEAFSNEKEESKTDIVQFVPGTKREKDTLLAAARGNMRENTWKNLCDRALKLTQGES